MHDFEVRAKSQATKRRESATEAFSKFRSKLLLNFTTVGIEPRLIWAKLW